MASKTWKDVILQPIESHEPNLQEKLEHIEGDLHPPEQKTCESCHDDRDGVEQVETLD